MSIVFDTCVMKDLNLLDEGSAAYRAIAWHLRYDKCYVTPTVAADVYREIRDSFSTQRAAYALDLMKHGKLIEIADDRDLIQLAVQARDLGLPWSVAFTAALAARLDCPILTNELYFDPAVREGFCQLKRYP